MTKKMMTGLFFISLMGILLPGQGAWALSGNPVIVLSPGHGTVNSGGKIDPGAVSGALLEKDINLEVAQKTKELLNNCPVDVQLTRNGDDPNNQLTGLYKIVNAFSPSIGIAIHTNSVASGNPSGTEAWSTVGGNNDPESKRLGGILTSQISAGIGIKNYGVKPETSSRFGGLYIHDWNTPASLIELGYFQGDKDALTNRRGDFAKAIAIGILQYFSLPVECLSSNSETISQVEDPIDAKFPIGQCTNYAARSRDDLFKVMTQTDEIQAMGWAAGRWDDNFKKLYEAEKSSYIVDDIPEINAVMVWDPGVGGANATYGHVGIVESLVDEKTVIVKDANWGGTTDVKSHQVKLLSGMHFIHTISYGQDANQGGSDPFVEREISGSFSVVNPLRNIYVDSQSEFVLTIDGKEVLSSQRPQNKASFSLIRWLPPIHDHTYVIRYRDLTGVDPAPIFTHTWWPNSRVNAAEKDPPLQVIYNYVLSPQSAPVGSRVNITAGASIPNTTGLIQRIDISIDGRQQGSINGDQGTYAWDTRDFSVGLHQIEFTAGITEFSGEVKTATTSITLAANGNNPTVSPGNNDGGACSETSIRSYLESKGSPLKEYTAEFIAAGETYNVDPRFIIGIANAESSLGTNLCANFNAWGIMASGKCRVFSSWPESVNNVTRLVGYNYLPKGQNNIPSFVIASNGGTCTQHCYCAGGCENWIKNVGSAYQQMGGNPETNDLTFKSCSTSSGPAPSGNQPPRAPSLISPENWIVTQGTQPQLCSKDNGDPDADDRVAEYDYQIFDSAQNWDSGWTYSGCVTPPQMGVYNYQWHVKVRDSHGAESSWSEVWHFGITGDSQGSMEKPSLISPANKQQLSQDTPVDLAWNASSQAWEYKVEVWGGPYSLMVPCDWGNSTSCGLGKMWPGTLFWHVKARDASGKETEWSDTWSFTVSNAETPLPVERPNLTFPQNNSTFTENDEIELSWDQNANATAYVVELWGGPYDRMKPCELSTDTTCFIGRMYPGVMSWRVKARRADNQFTNWSDTWTFEISQSSSQPGKPNAAMLSEPGNKAELEKETDITLLWNGSSQGVEYKVELWGDAYGQTMIPCDWSSALSCHIGTMWPGSASWHVLSRDKNGVESDWSDTWSFRVMEQSAPPAAEIPSLINPANNAALQQNEKVVLQWNPVSNGNSYQVEIWGGPYSTMFPCNWGTEASCFIGEMWPGTMQWHVKAKNNQGIESEWSETWTFTVNEIAAAPPEPQPVEPPQPEPVEAPPAAPGYVELVDNLELRSDGSGAWPPVAGDKLIAHIKVRNGGDERIHIANIGVRGRKNGSDFWDIGFSTIDLDGHGEWDFNPNNERPLEPGNYSFRISYTLDGSEWIEMGNEINFTVP